MQIIGRLGKDAEIRDAGGKKVLSFSVAVEDGYGDNKKTLWVDCSKWGEKTAIAEYLTKGTQVWVAGDPGIRTWENGAGITLRVADIQLIGSKPQQSGEAKPVEAPRYNVEPDLPF